MIPSALQSILPRLRVQGLNASARTAAAGFIAGAVFWHFVGFWTFISHVAFAHPETGRARFEPAFAAMPSGPIETGSLRPVDRVSTQNFEAACTALARDPDTRQTQQRPCRKLARPMKVVPASTRQALQAIAIETPAPQAALNAQQSLLTDWPIPSPNP